MRCPICGSFDCECCRNQEPLLLYTSADLAAAEAAAYKKGQEAALQWQPIETAPRDGTPHLRGLHVVGPHGASWDVLSGYVDCDGEFVDQFGDDPGWSDEDFTHWMPLPTPPDSPKEAAV